MALATQAPGYQQVTLGATTNLPASFTVFSACGWLYTGTQAVRKDLFYIGNDATPFAGGRYVWVGLNAAQVLTLEIYDGSTIQTFTGTTLLANTWYHWTYVKGHTADGHRVYLSSPPSDTTTTTNPTLDISQTVADGITVGGIFVFVPPGGHIANVKMWVFAITTDVNGVNNVIKAERNNWGRSHGLGGRPYQVQLWLTSPFRMPGDLYDYHGTGDSTGGTSWLLSPRHHVTNIGGTAIAGATDPAVLLPQETLTMLTTPPFALIIDDPGVISSGLTTIDHTEFLIDPASASGLPPNGIIQFYERYVVRGRFAPGVILPDTLPTVGTVSGEARASGGSTNFGFDALYFQKFNQNHEPPPVGFGFGEEDPLLPHDAWNTLTPTEARRRFLTYYWGFQSFWQHGGPPTSARPVHTSELWFLIAYTWDGTSDCVCPIDPDDAGGLGKSGGVRAEGADPFSELSESIDLTSGDGIVPTGTNDTDIEDWGAFA